MTTVVPFDPVRRSLERLNEVGRHLEPEQPQAHDADMSEVTRNEMNARLEASEARVATVAEGIRGELSAMRADFAAMRAQSEADAKIAQARASEFYADARSALTEIKLASEQNKVTIYGIGYKVIAWTLGTILAVGSVALGVWRALAASGGAA